MANGTGRGRWRAEISFFQMYEYYMGTLANVVGKVVCNLIFTNLGLCI